MSFEQIFLKLIFHRMSFQKVFKDMVYKKKILKIYG